MIPQQQGSPDWLKWRMHMIMASDVAAIMGLNPFCSRQKLWKQKMGLETIVETEKMRRGTKLEVNGRRAFEKLLDIKMEPKVIRHPDHEWLGCSLDGINEDNTMILEVKCGEKAFLYAKDNDIPDYYLPQIQCQIACTGLQHCHYYAFDGEEGILILVNRDQDFIDEMITTCKDFYDRCIINLEEPITQEEYNEENFTS